MPCSFAGYLEVLLLSFAGVFASDFFVGTCVRRSARSSPLCAPVRDCRRRNVCRRHRQGAEWPPAGLPVSGPSVDALSSSARMRGSLLRRASSASAPRATPRLPIRCFKSRRAHVCGAVKAVARSGENASLSSLERLCAYCVCASLTLLMCDIPRSVFRLVTHLGRDFPLE